jgi:Zn-dependent M32 family carboxypeptidase
MPDYDDCERMRKLTKTYNEMITFKTKASDLWRIAETRLDIGIMDNNISDKLSWKKQVIELCKVSKMYQKYHLEYYDGRRQEKAADNAIKAIENEVNVLKKIYDSTPR